MRIGVLIDGAGRSPGQMLTEMERVAGLGFDHAWLNQHPGGWDPLPVLAAADMVGPGLELGTAVVPTYPRHPVAMAASASTVQSLTGGRLVLGIGPSHEWVVRYQLGLSYAKPASHAREYLQVLLPLLRGEAVEHRGEHMTALTQLDAATTPAPSVLLSALGPVMLRTAGDLADGAIVIWVRPDTVADYIVPTITSAARGRHAPRVVVSAIISLTSAPDGLRAMVAERFPRANAMPAYRAIMDRGGLNGAADTVVAGDEKAVTRELTLFREAGTTDLIAVAGGTTRDRQRTLEFLAEKPGA